MLISFIYRVEYMLEMNEQEFIGLWETVQAIFSRKLETVKKYLVTNLRQ